MGGNNSCCEIRSNPQGSKLKNNLRVSALQENLQQKFDNAAEDESKQGSSVLRYHDEQQDQQEEDKVNVKREEVPSSEQEEATVQTIGEEFKHAKTEEIYTSRESGIPARISAPPRDHASSSCLPVVDDKMTQDRAETLIPVSETAGSTESAGASASHIEEVDRDQAEDVPADSEYRHAVLAERKIEEAKQEAKEEKKDLAKAKQDQKKADLKQQTQLEEIKAYKRMQEEANVSKEATEVLFVV